MMARVKNHKVEQVIFFCLKSIYKKVRCISSKTSKFIKTVRVKAGMKNAKARGKLIGRARNRNSALIKSLLEVGLSFREIARIAKCSHSSKHAYYRVKKYGG